MRVKPYLLASVMAVGLMTGALYHVPASAADGPMQSAPIVLAQNDEGNRSFFGNIFNRRKDTNSAKPLYMNKGSSSKVNPYDFSGGRVAADKRRRKMGSVSWEAFDQARREYAAKVRSQADKAVQRQMAQSERELAVMEASYLGNKAQGSGSASSEPRRMVYDPKKAWSYNPNQPRSNERSQPRIYNATP